MRGRVSAGVLAIGVACATKQPEPVAVTVEPEPAAAPAPADEPKPKKARKPASEPVDCYRPDPFGPIQMSPEQYTRRRGAGVTDLSKLRSSKTKPVEVCHVRGQQEFLMSVRCADGTPAFRDVAEVVRARTGSVGTGGRCRTIVDLYEVACPESTYAVYLDMYMCPEGTSFK
jgi:hypothetical protein